MNDDYTTTGIGNALATELDTVLSQADKASSGLDHLLTTLEDSLASVMRPESPSTEKAATPSPPEPVRCDLSERILGEVRRTQAFNRRVEAILARLATRG